MVGPSLLNLLVSLRRALTALIVIGCFVVVPALAQVTVRADISPQQGTTQDIFVFSVRVDGSRSAATPRLSTSADFDVTFVGPQSFIANINGVTTQRVSYIYHLTPKREGTLQTPAISVSVDGKTLEYGPVSVVVSQAAKQADNGSGGAPKDLVFLRQSAAPVSLFEGQQLINTLDLYTRVGLNDPALDDLATDGFWQETITEGDRSQRIVDGLDYQSIQVVKALYPLRSGKLTLPGRLLKARAAIPRPRAGGPSGFDPFDPFNTDIFGGFFQQIEERPIAITSNEITVQVKPLPPAPPEIKPLLGSVPIVGSTKVTVEYDLASIKTGESKSVTVHVATDGNLNPLNELKLAAPDGVKVYEERPETKRERKGAKLVLHRLFRYSVVPLKPGLIKIPPVELAFFNPSSNVYEVARSGDIAFAVHGEAIGSGSNNAQSGARIGGIPTMAPIPFGPDLAYEEASFWERFSEMISLKSAILIAAIIAGLALVLFIFVSLRPAPFPDGLSGRDLDQVTSLAELESFIRRLVAERIPSLKAESSLDEVRARIASQVKNPDVALALRAILDELEILRYGSREGQSSQELEPLKTRLRSLLKSWHAGS